MASEITVVLWTDGAADRGDASAIAVEAAELLHRRTGLATAVAAFDTRTVEPNDVVEATEADWTPASVVLEADYEQALAALGAAEKELARRDAAAAKAEARKARAEKAKAEKTAAADAPKADPEA